MSASSPEADHRAMQRALELAALGRATTQPNPRVGCVLVREGEVVGEGWHRAAGEPHAESVALAQAGARARGATAYVTLEPCDHHGRTPPCSQALIDAGIARLVYAIDDPDPRVRGQGARRLASAGVRVERGVCADAARELNVGFLSRLERGRPWLRLKLAASLDGRTALANGESRWITSDDARVDVHRWRAESAAILSTAATILADDPRLDARTQPPAPRQPARLVLDRRLRTPPGAQLFRGGGSVHLVSCEAGEGAPLLSSDAAHALQQAGAQLSAVARTSDGLLDLQAVLALAARHQFNEIWAEAGPTLAGALLDQGLVDELLVYLAPTLLGPDARPLARIAGLNRLADRSAWRVVDLRQIGPDARIMLRPS